jgi:hypothetical protein
MYWLDGMCSGANEGESVTTERNCVLNVCAAVLQILRGRAGWSVAFAVFCVCALRNLELPGLYMDAINPDYLVARWLHPTLANPVWVLPGPKLPILGNLYHGTQTLWLGLLTYGVLGTSVVSARLTHALFGAVIVLFAWLILRRVTGRPLLAVALATVLATDMAFLGSFRTQAYIILAGQAWMMCGVYLAVCAAQRGQTVGRLLLVLCGVSMGLAVYGYFVFLFFLPPVAWLAVFGGGREGAMRRVSAWAAGFAIGMLPYVVGYAGVMYASGGPAPFVEWLRNALTGLKPTGASPDYLSGLASAFTHARMGMAGVGNELMMTNQILSASQTVAKPTLTVAAMAVCLVGAWHERRRDPRWARTLLAFALLPAVYVLLAAGFGARMGTHHFTVLVAVGYLVLGAALHWLSIRLRGGLQTRAVAGVLLLLPLLVSNVIQQNRVHAALVQTGGTGMSSDALVILSRTALVEKQRAVWYFPEWGFFMPFAFLTGNQVTYELDVTPELLRKHLDTTPDVRVAFWKESDRARYMQVLQESGVTDIQSDTLVQRNGKPVVHVIAGQRKIPPLSANITDFGPHESRVGEPINLQPGGDSAIWVSYEGYIPNGTVIVMDGRRLESQVASGLVVAKVDAAILAVPGEKRIFLEKRSAAGVERSNVVSLQVIP